MNRGMRQECGGLCEGPSGCGSCGGKEENLWRRNLGTSKSSIREFVEENQKILLGGMGQ